MIRTAALQSGGTLFPSELLSTILHLAIAPFLLGGPRVLRICWIEASAPHWVLRGFFPAPECCRSRSVRAPLYPKVPRPIAAASQDMIFRMFPHG